MTVGLPWRAASGKWGRKLSPEDEDYETTRELDAHVEAVNSHDLRDAGEGSPTRTPPWHNDEGDITNESTTSYPDTKETPPAVSTLVRKGTFNRASTTSCRTHAIFADPEEMKAQVRQNLLKPAYSVDDYYHETGLWQAIARHSLFEQLTLSVIMLNAVWIAIDTDRNGAATLLEAEPIFQIAEHFFCVYFSFEWFVRFMAFERKRNGLRDKWFVFDSSLVFMMVGETWIVTIVMIFQSNSDGSAPGLGNASILRLFRLLRLSRMARMLRSFPELMILVKGITAATRSVILVMLLLVIFMYIFAIAFTQLAEGTSMGQRYFASVLTSMYSLLVYGTFLDNMAVVCRDIKNESVICLGLFFIFILLSALTLMNMLIGVLCEMVSNITATEKETRIVDFVTSKLQNILDALDEDGDRRISRVEFHKILSNPEAVLALDEVGVDPIGIMDFADFIFDDNAAESNDGLAFNEFMEVVLKLRGDNTATVKDIVDLRKFVFSAIEHCQMSLLKPHQRRQKMPLRRVSEAQGQRKSEMANATGNSAGATRKYQSVIEDGGFADSPQGPPKRTLSKESDKEAMKRLQGRVERLEDSLSTLLTEVKQICERLPPAPAPLPPLECGPRLEAGDKPLPHLLYTAEDLSVSLDKRSTDLL